MSLSACTQARTKKPMKPSFTPCFFSNNSLYWLRSAITLVMSTSLKVVSMAAVFCASFRRRAMVWRSRVIFTRSSRAASSAGDGARICAAATGWPAGAGCAAARSIAAIMSPLVTRPSLPRAGDAGRIDAGFRRHLAHRGRERRIGGRFRRRGFGLVLRALLHGGDHRRPRSAPWSRSFCPAGRSGSAAACLPPRHP